jgi:uncharacterized short protein YbdD (DUF466 family)
MRAPRAETVKAHTRIVARAVAALRSILGVPDYARYLAHQRAKHPDATPLSRQEFARERERARYEGTGSRCC